MSCMCLNWSQWFIMCLLTVHKAGCVEGILGLVLFVRLDFTVRLLEAIVYH